MDTARRDNDKEIIDDAVGRIRTGEQAAFEAIVRRYQRPPPYLKGSNRKVDAI